MKPKTITYLKFTSKELTLSFPTVQIRLLLKCLLCTSVSAGLPISPPFESASTGWLFPWLLWVLLLCLLLKERPSEAKARSSRQP